MPRFLINLLLAAQGQRQFRGGRDQHSTAVGAYDQVFCGQQLQVSPDGDLRNMEHLAELGNADPAVTAQVFQYLLLTLSGIKVRRVDHWIMFLIFALTFDCFHFIIIRKVRQDMVLPK